MSTPPPKALQAPPDAQGSPVRRRSRLRRTLAGLFVAVALLALLVALLPTLVTSRVVLGRVEAAMASRMGREVRLGRVEFGWRTPLHLEGIAIPPVAGEGDFAALEVRGVSVPLTLWEIARGGWQSPPPVVIDRIEGNLVRRPDGSWNWLALLEDLGGDGTDADKPPKDKDSAPSPLPINNLRVEVRALDLRVVDPGAGLVAGWEDGFLQVLWQGGGSPLTMDVGGRLRMNDELIPWKVRAKAENFVDGDGFLDPMGARLTASTGGMMAPHQLGEGGFFLSASAMEGAESVARVLVPVGPAMDFARGWDHLEALLPPAEGVLDLVLTATQRGQTATIGILLTGTELAADATPRMEFRIPPQSLAIEAALDYRMDTGEVRRGDVSITTSPLQASLGVARWHPDSPMDFGALEAMASLRLAEATALADAFLGGEGSPWLDGKVALALEAGDARDVRFDVLLEPGVLETLPTGTEWPAALRPLPLDLSPLSIELAGRADLQPEWESYKVEITSARFPGESRFRLDGSHQGLSSTAGAGMRWSGRLENLLALADGLLAEEIPLPSGEGEATITATVRRLEAGLLELAASVAFADLTLGGEMVPLQIRGENLGVSLAGNWDTGTETGALESLAVRSAPLDLDLSGEMGTESSHAELRGEIRLGSVARWAGALLPADLLVEEGSLEIEASYGAEAGEPVAVSFRMTSLEDPALSIPGLMNFQAPVALGVAMNFRRAGERLEAVDLETLNLAIGGGLLAEASLSYDMEEAEAADIRLALQIGYAPLLGWVDPAFWDSLGITPTLVGDTELELGARVPICLNASGLPEPDGAAEVEGMILTSVPMASVQVGEMFLAAYGLFDEREFSLTVDPADPASVSYQDLAATGFSEFDTTLGFGVQDLEMRTATGWSADRGLDFELDPLEVGRIETNTLGQVMVIDDLGLSLGVSAHPDFERFALRGLALEVPGLAEVRAETEVDLAEGLYSLLLEAEVDQLSRLFDYLPSGTESPNLSGRLRLAADVHGTLPAGVEGEAQPMALPVGTASLQLVDADLLLESGMRLEGLTLFLDAEIPDEGQPVALAVDLTMIEFFQEAFRFKPPRNLRVRATGNVVDLDALDFELEELSVANYILGGSGFLGLHGLESALADGETEGFSRWLDHVDLETELRLQQDLEGWTGFLDALGMTGFADFTVRLASSPGASVQLNTLFDIQDGGMVFADLLRVDGLEGTWEAVKGLRLSPAARMPPPPPAGRFTVRSLSMGPPHLALTMRRSLVTMRGFDGGVAMELESRDLMGGSATGGFTAGLRGVDPYMTSRLVFTGFDAGLLGGGRPSPRNDPNWEINGAVNAAWRLRDVPGDRMLDDLGFDLRTTRIGNDALGRLLRTLDQNQEDPRFQNALAALNFGTPRSLTMSMESGLVSMRTELGLAGGVRVPIPILDRQPVGEAWGVYGLNDYSGMLELSRFGMLMLLAPDLQTVERLLEERTPTP